MPVVPVLANAEAGVSFIVLNRALLDAVLVTIIE